MSLNQLIFNEYFLGMIFFLLGLCVFVPLIVTTFLHWKKTKKPRDFSYFTMMNWIFIFLITPSYFILLQNIGLLRASMNPTCFRLFNAALFGLTFYIFIPKIVEFYRKFQSNSKTRHLYVLIFLLIATFYSLSIQFFIFLKPFLKRWSH